ncbi:hypothetical protein GFB56_15515 [Ensifer sp. T173]|uniref:Integrase n=1 Tax=Ensifer canadensis TaxID=555315 RepID=A0AAW4FM25_9HYPH|nr:hypothetical protein [Ensifer canadensis]MBM3092214.1 hypothetical protein [Ensifer canadensis]UBI73939.1 hypothetical protein J3R84_10405 [Ensifer canadensis]
MPVRLNQKPSVKFSGVNPASRERSWLDGPYGAHSWKIKSGAGEVDSQVVHFDVKMADGRSLIEHVELYATAKEFVFWIREGIYTRLDSTQRHMQYANTVKSICYAMTSRNISSFAMLTREDIDEMTEQASFGRDQLSNVSKVVKANLDGFQEWADVPEHLMLNGGFNKKAFRRELGLPESWSKKEVNQAFAAASARLNNKLLAPVAKAPLVPVTEQNVSTVAMTFEAVHLLRHFIEAPTISFRPYLEGAGKRALSLGRESKRTPIPPPELALKLMEESARVVATDAERVASSYQEVLKSVGMGKDLPPLKFDALLPSIQRVFCACYILICSFTARRTSETMRTPRDCLAGTDDYGWWMKVYIAKTQRDYTWIPVPKIVELAVRTLQSFTSEIFDEKQKLISYYNPTVGTYVSPRIHANINEFAGSVGATQYVDTKKVPRNWHWVTRQFRRFFAVLFHYRYKGKIETLAHHLRHFDLEVTNDYVTLDPDNARVWAEEAWNFQIGIARSVASGETTYVGPLAEQLKKLAARLRRKFGEIRIVTESMAKMLAGTMGRNQLVLSPKLWVTCACPRTRSGCARAACQKLNGSDTDIGPNFAAAGPHVCPGCPFAIFDSDNLSFIDQELEFLSHTANAQGEANTIFGELQRANVVVLSQYRDKLKAAAESEPSSREAFHGSEAAT